MTHFQIIKQHRVYRFVNFATKKNRPVLSAVDADSEGADDVDYQRDVAQSSRLH